ncbi:MAG: hypothetical protein ACK507_00585 [bacterium]
MTNSLYKWLLILLLDRQDRLPYLFSLCVLCVSVVAPEPFWDNPIEKFMLG